MPKRLKFKELKSLLKKQGVSVAPGRGKGSHTLFTKVVDGKPASYPIPNDKEVLPCYVKGARRKFRLLPEDGISDQEFFDGK